MEKESGYLEPALPEADLRGSCPALSGKGSGSRGQRSLRPGPGGSQASGRAVRARQGSRPLIRLQYFQHPIAARGKRQSQGTGVVRGFWVGFFCELCFNFLGFNPQILWEDAVFVLLLLILPTGSSTKVTPSTSFA